MKKTYISPELRLSEGQIELIMANQSLKADGEIPGEGTIGWGGDGESEEADSKHRGWDVFGE